MSEQATAEARAEELIHEFYNNWKNWPASRPDDWPEDVERDKERTAKLNADFLSDLREFVQRIGREREREALERARKLADAVLEVPAIDYHDDPGGSGEWRCRFCFNFVRAGHLGGKLLPCISPFPHDETCAAILAAALRALVGSVDRAEGQEGK